MTKNLFIFVILLLAAIPAFSQTVDTAWVRRYNGPGNYYDYARAIAVDGSGNVYVTGKSRGSGTSDDYATIKYYPNGETAWVRTYDGTGNYLDGAKAIAVDGSGNVYVTGVSWGEDRYDYATIKYYPNGDTAWVRRYNGPGNSYDHAYAIAVDGSGNVYVTGESWDSGTYWDYTTIKYYSNGNTAWVRRYHDPIGNYYDGATAIVVDGSDNVYVTGWSDGGGTRFDYATIKYYSNGDTAWVRRYNGPPGNSDDEAYAIVVDGSGNVYVTGKSRGSGTSDDYATIKYYPNGDIDWVKRYDGPGNNQDVGLAIAVDGSGNVYVTGRSIGSGTSFDYATIKYYSNGDTAWVRRYNVPGNSDDSAHALAVDGTGNVYVTGTSVGSGTNYDYATIKYYPNGDIDWVKRYDGPGDSCDHAYAIAVDGTGNVYVTGTSVGSGTNYDYATIKYLPFPVRPDTLLYFAYSPVDLIVTDPKGDSIGLSFNTIPNATYDTTQNVGGDEDKDDVVTIPNPLVGQYMVKVKAEPGADTGYYSLTIKLDNNEDKPLAQNFPIPPPDQVDTFTYTVNEYLRGDPNSDGKKTVSDVIYLINYLFKGGPAPDPVSLGDANCDDKVTVSDVIYLINYLFKGGDPPCS